MTAPAVAVGAIERGVWAAEGSKSCAHWLAWKLGLTPGSAYERIRVAKALRGLPLLAEAMSTGRCSYAQARAITRVATPSCEATWIELAQHTTAAQLEKAARAVRRALNPDQQPAPKRATLTWDYDSDGWLRGSFLLHPDDAPAVVARLEQATRAEQADRKARRADVEDALKDQSGSQGPAAAGPSAPGQTGTPDSSAEESESSVTSGSSGASRSSGTSEASGPTDSSAEESGPPAPPYAEPFTYVEPPYPISAERLDGRALTPAEDELVRQWWATRARMQAKADAARAWAEHVDQIARTQHAQPAQSAQAARADGLVRALTRPEDLPPSTVNLQVDPLSGWARTLKDELLPPSTLAAIAKTLPGRRGSVRLSDLQHRHVTIRPLTPVDLTRADLGRRTRLISPRLRALLGALDGERCRFPSCTATHALHAHHVRYWRNGGRTDLANLVLVCSRHHTLIHTEGFQLVLSPDRTLTVRTAQDIPVPHHPPLPWQSAQDLTGPPHQTHWAGDRFDLDHVVWVLAQHSR